jgi:6-phosphogluconolactonase
MGFLRGRMDTYVVSSPQDLTGDSSKVVSALYAAMTGNEQILDLRWPSVVQAARTVLNNTGVAPFTGCVEIQCATDPLACHTSVLSATAVALLDGGPKLHAAPLEAGFLLFRGNGCGVAVFSDESVEWGSGRIVIPSRPGLRTGWEAFLDHVHIEGGPQELVDPIVSYGGLPDALLNLLPSPDEYMTSDVLAGVSAVYREMERSRIPLVFSDESAAARACAWDLRATIRIAVERRGAAYIALAGGSTPKRMFRALLGPDFSGIPWSRVHLFWSDERPVAPDSDRSNFRLAWEGFIAEAGVPETNIHRIRGEAEDIEAEAARYGSEIRATVPAGHDGVPAFDWIMLGVGTDGHTASLFPGREPDESDGRITATGLSPDDERRVTFTFRLLNGARRVALLAVGDGKARPIAQAISGCASGKRLPVCRLHPRGHLVFFLDSAAARIAIK